MCRNIPMIFSATLLVIFCNRITQSEELGQECGIATDFTSIIKQGRDTGKLPAGFVVRLEAHLFHATPADPAQRKEREQQGIDFNQRRDEVWEFSDNRVHRVTMKADETGSKRLYERVESTSFQTQKICGKLLAAEIQPLAERQGLGTHHFAGTGYDQGDRTVEILRSGELILSVGESCAEAGFSEKDAKSFSRLYESLADDARQAFLKKHPQ